MSRHRFVGASQRLLASPIDLDATAHHDRLQRPAFGGRAHDRCGRLVGELSGVVGAGTRMRFPHGQMDEDMRIERSDHIDDPFAIGGFDAMELGLAQAAPWRVDVDAAQLTDPGLGLEQRRDQRAQFAAHSADEYPLPSHNLNASPTIEDLPG